MFTIKCTGDYKRIQKTANFSHRLASRIKIPAAEYDKIMTHRENVLLGAKNYKPESDIGSLQEGTYYLSHIDDKFRRYYSIKQAGSNPVPVLSPNLPASMKRLQSLDNQFSVNTVKP
jgi:hydroxymethylglutaryl-CoA synthase